MGIKKWLTKHTTKPSDYAHSYATGLIELIEYLAASIVAFSGKRSIVSGAGLKKTMFETTHAMAMAGFKPLNADVFEPNIEELKAEADPELLSNAFRSTTAFLIDFSEYTAYRYMRTENAKLFYSALLGFIAGRSAGRFGFSLSPLQVAEKICELVGEMGGKLVGSFPSKEDLLKDYHLKTSWKKTEMFLELLLNHLILSQDGSTQYGFVIGSEKQTLGCVSAMIEVMLAINESLRRCTQDMHW